MEPVKECVAVLVGVLVSGSVLGATKLSVFRCPSNVDGKVTKPRGRHNPCP